MYIHVGKYFVVNITNIHTVDSPNPLAAATTIHTGGCLVARDAWKYATNL